MPKHLDNAAFEQLSAFEILNAGGAERPRYATLKRIKDALEANFEVAEGVQKMAAAGFIPEILGFDKEGFVVSSLSRLPNLNSTYYEAMVWLQGTGMTLPTEDEYEKFLMDRLIENGGGDGVQAYVLTMPETIGRGHVYATSVYDKTSYETSLPLERRSPKDTTFADVGFRPFVKVKWADLDISDSSEVVDAVGATKSLVSSVVE